MVTKETCKCVSSYKLPRTHRAADGSKQRICDRCYRPRVASREPPLTEDARDLAEYELGQSEG
ncbi:MAG: hypothetical protein MN733_18045 [Nitrososphaera sp.]|nr:hypothetical protein [Nitrososphaera sp.]